MKIISYNIFLIFFSVFSTHSLALQTDFKVQTKLNIRHSDNNIFPTRFPPGSAHETVDEGTHFEVSNIELFVNIEWTNKLLLKAKIDVIDLYEKNPTSSDSDINLDRFIIRYGDKLTSRSLPLSANYYIQAGKFNKFETQTDRHLESYGLVSTAFNRLEDSGFETGVDLANGWYARLSYTSGNPVFFRDPNALAGDNGVRDPEHEPGILILYDAEVEEFDLSDTPELGAGAGYRWSMHDGAMRFNVLLFTYERDLADSKELNGTFYGGDIDLFEFSELFTPGPISPDNDQSSVPLDNNQKKESGLNFWLYAKNYSLFAQYVTQDIGGLERTGSELEFSYSFNTGDSGLIKKITPVIRYSELKNDFGVPQLNPSPSIAWDWKKWDIGAKLHFSKHMFLTAEYAINQFEIAGGNKNNDELLITYTWRYD